MRAIRASAISNLISRLCVEANVRLRPDILKALKNAIKKETNNRAKRMLKLLVDNANVAACEKIATCQDTGITTVFIEVGQDAHIVGGFLRKAVDRGVRDGYEKGYFRKSVVLSPLVRKNTGTNTPAVLHTEIVPGDSIRVWIMPKGFGSENRSAIAMLSPTAGEEAIIDFILDVVKKAGPDACPPFVLGVGIGGTFEYAALLSKKALLEKIDMKNPDPRLRLLEKKLLNRINALGTGPMGFGGKTTALGVNILSSATHIAGLPVAVNVSCHATRSAYGKI